MSAFFLKFKRRFTAFRIIKSAMIGLSAGLALVGLWLMLIRLAVIGLDPLTSLFVGLGSMLVGFAVTFLLSRRSDKSLAEELDADFGLSARVQTMVEYCDQDGDMVLMQREDANLALSMIPVKSYKFKKFWVYALVLLLSASILGLSFLVPDIRGITPPEEKIPFELSELQEKSLLELISEVEASEKMEDEFKFAIADELRALLSVLRETELYDDMTVAVTDSMNKISEITYESSTATELLTTMWSSNDIYFRHLAKAFAVSLWDTPDESGFKEQMYGYLALLMGDNEEDESATVGAERAIAAIDGMKNVLNSVLISSGLSSNDEMYLGLVSVFNDQSDGLSLIDGSLSEDEIRAKIPVALGKMYEAIVFSRSNSEVGEMVNTRLENLFLVPKPRFERPDFYRNNLPVGGSVSGEEIDPEDTPGPGGMGGGVAYGSDDLVLDPLTGELKKYGDLINDYNAKLYEKLEGGLYTEEQKKAILKYFELLFGGIEKEEGN